VLGVIKSVPFQMRKAAPATGMAVAAR